MICQKRPDLDAPPDAANAPATRRRAKYDRLIAAARAMPAIPTAVAHPCDETSLEGVVVAATAGMIEPILVGPERRIRSIAETLHLNVEPFQFVDLPHSHAAAAKAVEIVRQGRAELLMKGSLHTDELLAEVDKMAETLLSNPVIEDYRIETVGEA